MSNTLKDRIRGSLIGGAIGDALGYPVEFIDSFGGIQARYGEQGITRLDVRWTDTDSDSVGKAVVSDDTQMTLFTANGLLNAKRLGIEPKFAICRAYLEWLETQDGRHKGKAECWIRDVPRLNVQRAPGITCTSSLRAISKGQEPINNSKGCGGVMRVAPIPLYAATHGRMSIEDAERLASDAAEITHQHPLGFISAALMAHVIYRLALDENPTRTGLEQYILEGMGRLGDLFPKNLMEDLEMMAMARVAINLSANDRTDLQNIKALGEGWVADEALAIALYCCLRHFDSFEDAVIASVNHGGDSDSTGAITGNILGAAVGYDAIPQFFKDDLELHDVILHMADDLYYGEVTKFQRTL